MRLSVDMPEWEYIQFKNKVGDRNMSNYIRELIKLVIRGDSQEDIIEKEQDKMILLERVEKLREDVKITKRIFDESVNNLRLAESDLKACQISSHIQDAEKQEQERIQNQIKLKTLKDRAEDF